MRPRYYASVGGYRYRRTPRTDLVASMQDTNSPLPQAALSPTTNASPIRPNPLPTEGDSVPALDTDPVARGEPIDRYPKLKPAPRRGEGVSVRHPELIRPAATLHPDDKSPVGQAAAP